jgi:hypothetical protein
VARLPEEIKAEEIQKLREIVNVLNGDPPELGVLRPDTPFKRAVLSQRREALNKSPQFRLLRETLESYVGTWLKADRHFGQWESANPRLAQCLEREVRSTPHFLMSIGGDRPYVGRCLPRDKRMEVIHRALWDFLDLARSPMRSAIGRCQRCERYYLNWWGHANKVYCSRQCTTRDWAERSTEKRRKQERQRKIDKANRWLGRFAHLENPPSDWKAWLAERSGLTQKWITRGVNRGDIHPPQRIGR